MPNRADSADVAAVQFGVVNAGNTLRRNVINDSIAARLESLAVSVDSDANVCPKTGSTHRYPTVQIDRGQHPG